MRWNTSYYIENPARMAGIAAVKLAHELAGVGFGCHSVAELQGLLRDLGVEVEIVEGEPEWQERLAVLRQLCERRAAIIARVERAVAGLIEVLREVQGSSDEIVKLARQFDDNFGWQHARQYFTTSLGYFLWAAKCELREQDPNRWHFEPHDREAGVRDALAQYDRWCIEDLLARAEQGVDAAREERLRARGLIKEDTSERLYRLRQKVIRVGERTLQAGQVISLRAQEAAAMGESVEPLDEAAQEVA